MNVYMWCFKVTGYAVRLITATAKRSGKGTHVTGLTVRLMETRPSNVQGTVSVLGHNSVCVTTPTSESTVRGQVRPPIGNYLVNKTPDGFSSRIAPATIVATPPEIITGVDTIADFFSNLTILVDRSLIFSCFAEGKPELSVQILKDGRQLSPVHVVRTIRSFCRLQVALDYTK